jgi:Tol biopolymer transport system component
MGFSKQGFRILKALAAAMILLSTGCVPPEPEVIVDSVFPGGLPIERVSINASGTQGNDVSEHLSISADGQYVAFSSVATNLVVDDTNVVRDIFVYDRQTDIIERVSVGAGGTQGNGLSDAPSISADGRYVAFYSVTANLVADDTNGAYDIFVYDRQTDSIERVSVSAGGTQGDNHSFNPSISADGRYVAFESDATNLVAGDTNGVTDTFLYDRQTDSIERVSVSAGGTQGDDVSYLPAISADGKCVAFQSFATTLVAGDTNGKLDIFVYDRQLDSIERVSVVAGGTQASADSYDVSISADGRYVAFASDATNLVAGNHNGAADIFVYDRQTESIERVSVDSTGAEGDIDSFTPSISADGRYVAFASWARNLVAGDTNGAQDLFVYDRQADSIGRVSVAAGGTQGDFDSWTPLISADGRYVAFASNATNLVTGDTNGVKDIFAAPVP